MGGSYLSARVHPPGKHRPRRRACSLVLAVAALEALGCGGPHPVREAKTPSPPRSRRAEGALLPLASVLEAPPVASVPTPAPPAALPSEPGVVRFHLYSEHPEVWLWVLPKKGGAKAVCRAPCGVIVDGRLGEEFYFEAAGAGRSESFRLTNRTGDVRVWVDAGSSRQRLVGGVLFGAGLIVALVTVFPLAVTLGAGVEGRDVRASSAAALGVAFGLGVASTLAGIRLIVTNRTRHNFR